MESRFRGDEGSPVVENLLKSKARGLEDDDGCFLGLLALEDEKVSWWACRNNSSISEDCSLGFVELLLVPLMGGRSKLVVLAEICVEVVSVWR